MIYVLWLITTLYAERLGTYPTAMLCFEMGGIADKTMKEALPTMTFAFACIATMPDGGAPALKSDPPSERGL